jgi:LAO/AO transport system kinase
MMHPLATRIKMGDVRALARVISYIEDDHEDKIQILRDLHDAANHAHYIGITGSPGAGKSSLVNQLITFLRKIDLKVGIIAVDPTSPFSGGALLGDRVRMNQHFTDPNVFIRSMGTRGSLGGLSRSTKEAVRVMDAFGFDVILIETVGVGQSELDIMKIADTTAVVLNPGSGDAVQVFKAGIMEIADLFVVNKADFPGVQKLIAEINSLLDLVKHNASWRPPIVKTVSTRGEGLEALWGAIKQHQFYLNESGEGAKRRKQFLLDETMEFVEYQVVKKIRETEAMDSAEWLKDVAAGRLDPYTAAEQILEKWLGTVQRKEG